MFIVREREAGNVICWCTSLFEALEAVYEFEEEDKQEEIYVPDFYEIIEEEK